MAALRTGVFPSVVPPLFLGGLAALGQAPFGWWICTLIGLTIGMIMVLQSARWQQATLRGWALGVGYFGVSLSWLVAPFMVDAARYAWMAPFALLLMAAGLALLWGGASGIAHRLAALRWRWLLLAVAFTGAELMRARLFTGFPWASPGHIWIDTVLAPAAACIGAAGLGAVTFLLTTLLAQVVLVRRMEKLPLAILVLFFAGIGVTATQRAATSPSDQPMTVRLIQPNAPQHQKWDPKFAYDFVQRQLDLTAMPPTGAAPDLILWPETAVPTLMQWADGVLRDMAAAAQGKPVLFGVQRGEGVRFFNSLALLDANGQISTTYDKHHLVPFGEYIPFGDQLSYIGINAFAAQSGQGYSAGPGARVLDLGALGKMLPLICYEAVFPRDIRAAPERPDWILHATNDAWFGNFSGPQQHLVQARFRAIEFGLPVIRVANTGVSAVIEANGNLRAEIPLNTSGFIDEKIPGSLPATPYSRYGDLPLTFLVLAVTGVFVARRRTKSI
ncbi:apolipoprotein N-acyltransferase [Aliiroseovarius lamellibrachiae]|uniref:apolipoprotein N-acyltransferase n=1 Tax=Aliiroseovarius lamellibrachiae TaxID=1924933 RepID=UPI001BE051F9|nr:apolipoprotein N-acyltransferase [Aliiroseovarius lamellibrachiae]MBT2130382.1 apolipoprotein N-acyltransferase [Aliiroseovarius lamellibrachiae]